MGGFDSRPAFSGIQPVSRNPSEWSTTMSTDSTMTITTTREATVAAAAAADAAGWARVLHPGDFAVIEAHRLACIAHALTVTARRAALEAAYPESSLAWEGVTA